MMPPTPTANQAVDLQLKKAMVTSPELDACRPDIG
jgi:hypothetical protein